MPQSLSKVYVHIVFSTKRGQHLICDSIRREVQSYIIGVLSNLGSYTREIYANVDHIHVLSTLPRTITIADLISKIKTSTSKWMKTKGVVNFYWQDGYGVFSVSATEIDRVSRYILNQHEHHQKITFQDEYRLFLNEFGIDFDERFVWD